ncbi:mRNA guanylyltransferase [Ranunculus cassubicifolius]
MPLSRSHPQPHRFRNYEPEAARLTGCKRLYPPRTDYPPYKRPRTEFPPFKYPPTSLPRTSVPRTGLPWTNPKLSSVQPREAPKFPQATSLPRGWLRCPCNGEAIDHIIPSKVPLSESFDSLVESELRYPVPTSFLLGTGKVEIGVIIDLTSSLYYQQSYCSKIGIQHVKIPCGGKHSIPDGESVNKFVFDVLRLEGRTDKYILVHCSDGYNDTGYMIVHYLMRSRCFSTSVTEALQIFAKARPPGIFRQSYIDALYDFYHENKPETVICPSVPEWRSRPYLLDLNAEPTEEEEEEEDDDVVVSTVIEEGEIGRVMKNDDVLGDTIPDEQQTLLREVCYGLLKIDKEANRNSLFPGPHPVSLSRKNLHLLGKRFFYTTWKAVGTRYMMLLTWDGCYLIDRYFNFRRVQMKFPTNQTIDGLHKKTHNFTLIDGEMVIDTMPHTGKQERRYLAYDLMAINNESIIDLPFHERLRKLEKEVIEPRNQERSSAPPQNYQFDMEPFRVRRKEYWPLSRASKLVDDLIPKLSHPSDGLIFQGWDDQYASHNHGGLLKWQSKHTTIFLFEVDKEGRQLLFLTEQGQKHLMEGDRVVFDSPEDALKYSGKIIECSWISKKVWSFLSSRSDQWNPNAVKNYLKVIKSIKNSITRDLLVNEVTKIVSEASYTDRQKDKSPKD